MRRYWNAVAAAYCAAIYPGGGNVEIVETGEDDAFVGVRSGLGDVGSLLAAAARRDSAALLSDEGNVAGMTIRVRGSRRWGDCDINGKDVCA